MKQNRRGFIASLLGLVGLAAAPKVDAAPEPANIPWVNIKVDTNERFYVYPKMPTVEQMNYLVNATIVELKGKVQSTEVLTQFNRQ